MSSVPSYFLKRMMRKMKCSVTNIMNRSLKTSYMYKYCGSRRDNAALIVI